MTGIETIIINTLLETLYAVGGLFAAGLLLSFMRREACQCYMAGFGYNAILVTGWLGTPVHELSHAAMCVLFGHQITEIKLFQKPDASGTMGYVNHRYNPMNPYQQIGNFFIGVAPLIGGTLAMMGLMRVFEGATMAQIVAVLEANWASSASGVLTLTMVSQTFVTIWGLLFNAANFTSPLFYVFLFLCICIASHMALSTADVKGTVPGVVAILVLFLVLNIIFGNTAGVGTFLVRYNVLLISFLTIAVVLSLINLMVSLVCYGVSRF